MNTITEELMTRGDVAKLFKVSRLTVIRMEKAGKLPALRIGAGSVRYRKADVEAFLTRATVAQ